MNKHHLAILAVLLMLFSLSHSQDSLGLSDSSVSKVDGLELNSDTSDFELNLTSALMIECGESPGLRWISIATGPSDTTLHIRKPEYVTDANAGSFEIIFSGVDTSTYLGDRMYRGHGSYPIHYQVTFIDSQTLSITGKTLPYDDIRLNYSFDMAEYRIDFEFQDIESGITDITEAANAAVPHAPVNATKTSDVMGESLEPFMDMLYDAVLLAAAALLIILLILVIILMVRKIRKTKPVPSGNFSEMLDSKAAPTDSEAPVVSEEAVVFTTEMREEKIRALMEQEKVSYDEAALRVQYEMMNQDNG